MARPAELYEHASVRAPVCASCARTLCVQGTPSRRFRRLISRQSRGPGSRWWRAPTGVAFEFRCYPISWRYPWRLLTCRGLEVIPPPSPGARFGAFAALRPESHGRASVALAVASSAGSPRGVNRLVTFWAATAPLGGSSGQHCLDRGDVVAVPVPVVVGSDRPGAARPAPVPPCDVCPFESPREPGRGSDLKGSPRPAGRRWEAGPRPAGSEACWSSARSWCSPSAPTPGAGWLN